MTFTTGDVGFSFIPRDVLKNLKGGKCDYPELLGHEFIRRGDPDLRMFLNIPGYEQISLSNDASYNAWKSGLLPEFIDGAISSVGYETLEEAKAVAKLIVENNFLMSVPAGCCGWR